MLLSIKIIVIVVFSLLVPIRAWSACVGSSPSWTVASPYDDSDVQDCITAASTGDTINIPACDVTWGTTVTITETKNLTILGAGSASSIITGTTDLFDMNFSGSRISGLNLKIPSTHYTIKASGTGWRVDNCKIESTTVDAKTDVRVLLTDATHLSTDLSGIFYSNTFINARIVVYGSLEGLSFLDERQHILWAAPVGLGGDGIYIEDNSFTLNLSAGGNIVDTNYAGSYVFRYNTIDGGSVEVHSIQGNNRAGKRWEFYGNIIGNTDVSIYYPYRIRGGTGVIFYNSVPGNWTNDGIAFDNVRSYDAVGDGGLCDGDSTWDGNEDATGYPCRDQIGRGYDTVQWEDTPVGAYAQPLVPAYEWLNRNESNAELGSDVINTPSENHIKANRDFYSYNASFDGTTGVGCGTLGNRPATCTTGVGYWATAQSCSDLTGMVGASPSTKISGTLYKCTATNTWTSYYTPYEYPHPLRGEPSGGFTGSMQ